MQLTLSIPDDVARALPLPQDERRRRLQLELGCLLYAKGWLSYGQAARVSEMTGFFLRGEMVEFGRTERVFQAPWDHRTEDYVRGRFG